MREEIYLDFLSNSIMNSIHTFINTDEMARVSLSKCTRKCLQLFCILILLSVYCVKRNQLNIKSIINDQTLSKNSALNYCLLSKYNKSLLGEDGLEVVLSDEDKKVYKKEISKGYRDFAFNEFVSQNVSIGTSENDIN